MKKNINVATQYNTVQILAFVRPLVTHNNLFPFVNFFLSVKLSINFLYV